MVNTVPCLNPEVCGVQSHEAGSQAHIECTRKVAKVLNDRGGISNLPPVAPKTVSDNKSDFADDDIERYAEISSPVDAVTSFIYETGDEWNCNVDLDDNGRAVSITLETWSPAGEDMVIEYYDSEVDRSNHTEIARRFVRELKDKAEYFDPEENAEMWYGANNGEPDSLRELLDDAEEQKTMYEDLANRAEAVFKLWNKKH